MTTVLLSATGGMSSHQRRSYFAETMELLKECGIDIDEGSPYLEYFASNDERFSIAVEGLYLEPSLHEAAFICLNSRELPMLVDPLGKCLGWIRRRFSLQSVLEGTETDLWTKVSKALEDGAVCVISLLEGGVDPRLLRFYRRRFPEKREQRLFLHSPEGNLQLPPELMNEVYVINLTVSEETTRELLRNSVGLGLFPKVFHLDFVLDLARHRCTQARREVEAFILDKLAGPGGDSITSNEGAIASLVQAKHDQEALARSATQVDSSIDRVAAFFSNFSSTIDLGCVLYDLTQRIEVMRDHYSFSFKVFERCFIKGIQSAHQLPHTNVEDPRDSRSPLELRTIPITSIMEEAEALEVEAEGRFYVTYSNREETSRKTKLTEESVISSIFCFLGLGTSAIDRLVIATVISFSIRKGLTQQTSCFLEIVGLDVSAERAIDEIYAPPPWLSGTAWSRVRSLEDNALIIDALFLKTQNGILENAEAWHSWYNREYPDIDNFPPPFSDPKSLIVPLLLVWALRPDRFLNALQGSIGTVMGEQFLSIPDMTTLILFNSANDFPLYVIDSSIAAAADMLDEIAASSDHVLTLGANVGENLGKVEEARAMGNTVLLKLEDPTRPAMLTLAGLLTGPSASPNFRFRASVALVNLSKVPDYYRQISTTVMLSRHKELTSAVADAWKFFKEDKIESATHAAPLKKVCLSIAMAHTFLALRRSDYFPFGMRSSCFIDCLELEHTDDVVAHLFDRPKVPEMSEIISVMVENIYEGSFTSEEDRAIFKMLVEESANDVLYNDTVLRSPLPDLSVMSCTDIANFLTELRSPSGDAVAVGLPWAADLYRSADLAISFGHAGACFDKASGSEFETGVDISVRTKLAEVLRACSQNAASEKSNRNHKRTSMVQSTNDFQPFNTTLKREMRAMEFLAERVAADASYAASVMDGRRRESARAKGLIAFIRRNRAPTTWVSTSWGVDLSLSTFIREVVSARAQQSKWKLNNSLPVPLTLSSLFDPKYFLYCLKRQVAVDGRKAWSEVNVQVCFMDDVLELMGEAGSLNGVLLSGVQLYAGKWETSDTLNSDNSHHSGDIHKLAKEESLFCQVPLLKLSVVANELNSNAEAEDDCFIRLYRSVAKPRAPLFAFALANVRLERAVALNGCCLTLDFSS